MLSRRLLRIKAIQSLYATIQRGEEHSVDTSSAVEEFSESADKCYELYLTFLSLFCYLRDYAEERIEIGKQKFHPTEQEKNPNLKWINNPVIEKISKAIEPFDGDLDIQWSDHRELIAQLYNEMTAEDYYTAYMQIKRSNFASDKRVLVHFIAKNLVDNVDLEKILEDHSIYWVDDIDYAASFVCETINSLTKDEGFHILEKYSDEDVELFGRNLISKSIEQYDENFNYIVSNSLNWDAERITFMDKIILLVAIAELREFPTIPVKVTLDEYIEIAKYYSTEDSANYINGMINKIMTILTKEGLINKSDRGLL